MIKIFTSQQGQLALLSCLKIFQLVLTPFFRQFISLLGVQKALASFIPGKSSSATFISLSLTVSLLIDKEIIHHSSPVNVYVLINLWLCTANATRPKSSLTLQTSRYKLEEWGLQQMHTFTQGQFFTIFVKITLIWIVSCTIPSSLQSQCHFLLSWMRGSKMNTLQSIQVCFGVCN